MIFYSWQSDLPNSTNRGFIQQVLECAAKEIRADDSIAVEPVIDRDTAGVPGSPDIAATILEKIDKCDVFACDVSIINPGTGARPTPNPNVLIELGYALKRIGWSRVIMILNTEFGNLEALPFDLRMKRVLTYSAREDEENRATERKKLQKKLTVAVKEIFRHAEKTEENSPEVATLPTEDDYSWRDRMRQNAMEEYSRSGFTAYVEAFAVLSYPRIARAQPELLEAAEACRIRTFGWPIGVMGRNAEHMRPKPINDGIINSVICEGKSCDFWAIKQDGSFYLLKTLWEDTQADKQLFFNTRIHRTAEMILYLIGLYRNLGVSEKSTLTFQLRHAGLQGRHISATSTRNLFGSYGPSTESEVESEIVAGLATLEDSVSQRVSELLNPVFIVFDFFKVGQDIYEEIVEEFKKGRLT